MSGGQRMAERFCHRGCHVPRDELDHFFRNLQDKFLAGRLDALITHFDTPLVVYSVVGVVVLRNAEEIVQRMKMYREALLALATVSGRFELVSEDSLINNRIRVTVRSVYIGADGAEVTSSLARYFLVRQDEGLIVEMIEYLETAIPSDEVERIVH